MTLTAMTADRRGLKRRPLPRTPLLLKDASTIDQQRHRVPKICLTPRGSFQNLGPIMVQLDVQRMPLRGFGEPSVSRSFN
jgi:hypothetical protein